MCEAPKPKKCRRDDCKKVYEPFLCPSYCSKKCCDKSFYEFVDPTGKEQTPPCDICYGGFD